MKAPLKQVTVSERKMFGGREGVLTVVRFIQPVGNNRITV